MRSRLLCAAVVCATAFTTVVVNLIPSATADSAGAGGDFVPLASAVTVYATASGAGGASTAGIAAGQTVTAQVAGVGTVPADGVSAVMLRVQGTVKVASGYLTVFSPDDPRPAMSNLNMPVNGTTLATSSVVPVSADGRVAIFNAAGTATVTATVEGYFTSDPDSATTGGIVPITPINIVDTRSGLNIAKAKLAAGASATIKLTGGSVPATATSVMLDAIAIGATATGNVSDNNGSTFGYLSGGNTSAPMLAVLNASGQATFKNNGTAAIDFLLSVHAYSTASTATGAGYRPIRNTRLAAAVSIAANGTTDVQVLGAGGLPTRGITAVGVALAGTTASAASYVRAYPSSAAEPAPSTLQYPVSAARATFLILTLGTSGAIRVHNTSTTSAVRIYLDVVALFGPALGSTPPVDGAATALAQMTGNGTDPGAVEYAYTDGLGQSYHGYQVDPTDFRNIQWTADPTQETFTGKPALSALPNNAVLAAAQHYDSDIYMLTSTSQPDWASDLGDAGGSMALPPAAATQPDGSGILFAVDADGALWNYPLSASPRYWRKIWGTNFVATPSITPVSGGLRIFMTHSTGVVLTQALSNGTLGGYFNLGGTNITGSVSVVTDPSGRLRVFARQADSSIVTNRQAADGSFSTTWTRVGSLAAAGPPAVGLSASGAVVLLAQDRNGYVYESDETAANSGTFGAWLRVANQTEPSATNVSMTSLTRMPNGWTWMGVFRTVDNSTRVIVPKTAASPAARTPRSTAAPLAHSMVLQVPPPR